MPSTLSVTILSATLFVVFAAGSQGAAQGATPLASEVSAQQIEADWLRQEQLRTHATLIPAPGEKVSLEQDAAGGCNGVKDGFWGFHTADEENPWWRVDLERPVALRSLREQGSVQGYAAERDPRRRFPLAATEGTCLVAAPALVIVLAHPELSRRVLGCEW